MLALLRPEWLYHHLRVRSDPAEVAAFRSAVAGPRVIPWAESIGSAAEDWFHLLAAPPAPQRRSLSLEGCRILAGQLRDAAEARQRRMAERAATSRACAFCLHRLLPVPGRGKPRPPDPELFWVGFWSADWTPWRAILALRDRWPGLSIAVRPIYDDP